MQTLPQPHSRFNFLARSAQPHMPEALCSVNGYFHLTGFHDRFQATGRGTTPLEAAANLRGTIEATREALAPKAPTQVETLGMLLACGLQKAVAKDDLAMVERLSKAAALVLAGAVSPGEREGLLTVRSQQHPDQWYEVEQGHCSCPDYQHRHKDGEGPWYCKHGLSAMMYARMQTQQEGA